MRSMLAVCLLVIILVNYKSADGLPQESQGKYTTRYDHIDVDAILKSPRLLKSYMHCVLDRGPCTREGLELKKHIPDVMKTECAKCSAKQKEWAGKILSHLQQLEKGYWNEVLEKYDPDGTFKKKFEYGDDDSDGDY